jgi:periplasmic protein TonB
MNGLQRVLLIVASLTFGSAIMGMAWAQEAAELSKMPEPKHKAHVVYPKAALEKGIEGTVYVKVWVDETGVVKKAEVLKSDAPALDAAAVEAAKGWTFSPALSKESKPVGVWLTLPFKFKLEAKEKPEGKTK